MSATPTFPEPDSSRYSSLSPDREISLYRNMLRVRQVEERLAELYKEGGMRTPTHFGVGQEGVAVGVCDALQVDDVVYSHHRCHNHYVAKGGRLLGLVAELYGRIEGCSKGRGGSVHLTDRNVGMIASTPILGQGMALAVGSALAFRMNREARVAISFFGEGALDEGIAYECFNYAAIKKLPVLFVCENNFYATESPIQVRQPVGTELCDRARAFKLQALKIDGNDVSAVFETTQKAVRYIRDGVGPFFLECETYRWLEHVGPMYDHELKRTYRSKEEVDAWMQRCPIARAARSLVARGIATELQLGTWHAEVKAEIERAVAEAKASDWPNPSTLFENVF
jgi:TPP-dependent pyruvate/acetoin dehydrogenase alpha subunit